GVGFCIGLVPPGGSDQCCPSSETKIEGFSSSASLWGYGATTIQYVNPRHGGENLTIDGSVTWPEPSGVGMVRGASIWQHSRVLGGSTCRRRDNECEHRENQMSQSHSLAENTRTRKKLRTGRESSVQSAARNIGKTCAKNPAKSESICSFRERKCSR